MLHFQEENLNEFEIAMIIARGTKLSLFDERKQE